MFSLLWLLDGPAINTSLLWQPGLIALCLFAGQLTQFLALERGDVSVAVPVFGLKVVIIAFLSPMITGDAVGLRQWIAALLSVLGILCLNRNDGNERHHDLTLTLIASGAAAFSFAIFDLLVQRWGPAWGVSRLLPCIFWINAVFSISLITRFHAPLSSIPRAGWPWLVGGSLLMAAQSIVFVSTVAIYGKATSANIVFASRGLFSVVLVWMIGHWFTSQEQHLGAKVLRRRLIGALLMLTAIALVTT